MLLWLLISIGCSEASNNGNEQQVAQVRPVQVSNGLQLEPALQQLDSIRIFFYLRPFTDHAELYTRYYQTSLSQQDTLLTMVSMAIQQPFQEDTLRNCRSEGKIFCYRNGKVAQVLYFSKQHKGCTHLYMIHTGRYYYFPLPAYLYEALMNMKAAAPQVS